MSLRSGCEFIALPPPHLQLAFSTSYFLCVCICVRFHLSFLAWLLAADYPFGSPYVASVMVFGKAQERAGAPTTFPVPRLQCESLHAGFKGGFRVSNAGLCA